jgi:hypothetical protein
MVRVLTITMLMGCGLLLLGCGSNTLETGYQPRPLKASSAMRRSYYASPFSPEARAPSMEKDQEIEARRPKPGY